MVNVVTLHKTGKFYSAYENDAYVLHALLNYKLCSGRVGFPCEVLGKVVSILEDNKISYIVKEKEKEVNKKIFPKSYYNKYLAEGKRSDEISKKERDLIEKIQGLSKEKIDKIMEYIEKIAYEE